MIDESTVEAVGAEGQPESAVYKLDRDEDARLAELRSIERYYEGRQHDHIRVDWWGDPIMARGGYLSLRQAQAQKTLTPGGGKIERSIVARRPCAQAGLAARINGALTDMAIPSMPAIQVAGDEDAADCATAMLAQASAGTVLADLRTMAGRVGSAAVIVEVVGDKVRLTPRKAADVYVARWKDIGAWEPADVIYQRKVDVDVATLGRVATVRRIRTTRYTETDVIRYKDVDCDWPDDKPIPEASRYAHGAGRCPVIWHQNLPDCDRPEGAHDLVTEANLELSDDADMLLSLIMTATAANTEPTVWKKEQVAFQQLWGRIQKGTGKLINLSEKGDVGFLEISGATIEMAWDTFGRFVDIVCQNSAAVLPEQGLAGKKTATEIERSWSAMTLKAQRLRASLEKTIVAICEVLLSMARSLGVSSTEAPVDDTICLPPIVECVEREEDDDEEEGEDDDPPEEVTVLRARSPGRGRTVSVQWPAMRSVPPSDLAGVLNGLSAAAKGAQVLSQRTAVGEACSAIGRNDAEGELERIREEEEEEEEKRAKRAEAMFAPGPEATEEAATGAAAASDPGEEGDQEGDEGGQEEGIDDTQAGGQPPQKE